MDEVVKKHGRKTIAWEGFAGEGKTPIPHDITVMVFESLYNRPDHLVADGYKIINTAWQPLYVVNGRNWTPKYIYGWNLYRWENWWDKSQAFPNGINVPPTPLVLGAQMCAWEQADSTELPSLRQRLAAMSERTWNTDAGKDWTNFSDRLAVTDRRLDSLLNVAR
jgi:hexosaminidase